MKEYHLSERCAYLVILMKGGLKPEFDIRKRIIIIIIIDQVLNG